MPNSQHTPGPWEAAGQHIITQEGGILAFMPDKTEWNSNAGVLAANAHLIAAAPELLEALKEVARHAANLEDDLKDADAWDDVEQKGADETHTKARAAIAKAEGRA